PRARSVGTAEFSRFLRLCIGGRQETKPRARRKEHPMLENAILRRRSTSAFSHSQDPLQTSTAIIYRDAQRGSSNGVVWFGSWPERSHEAKGISHTSRFGRRMAARRSRAAVSDPGDRVS